MPVRIQDVHDLRTERLRSRQELFPRQGGIHDHGLLARLVDQEVRVVVERWGDDLLDAHERPRKDETFINLPGSERNLKTTRGFEAVG